MRCKKCRTKMVQCKKGITIGSLENGVKLSLYKCPRCGYLKKKEEKVKF